MDVWNESLLHLHTDVNTCGDTPITNTQSTSLFAMSDVFCYVAPLSAGFVVLLYKC